MIKYVFFDFDGVFTDGNIYINGKNIDKKYNIKDGMGFSILRENNIKYGLISGFKKDFTINNDSFDLFTSHLKFDNIKIGVKNKLQVLEEILKIENLTFMDIAYIGDDINDISILEKVKLSACPSDAVDECKNIVKYICKNKGGDCCVREFIDYIIQFNKFGFKNDIKNDIINQIKHEANYQLNNLDLTEIELLIQIITNSIQYQRNIYCTGVGKSENISIHCSNLMKSIGINSHYLNCLNSIHGDIGTIRKGDLILLFSKSGNTIELLNIIPSLKLHEPYIILINCNKDGILNKLCDKSITLPFRNEIICNINTIPTNSYMSMLFFINILISSLANIINIDYNQYKMNHPGGNIGLNLMKISDIIQKEFPKIKFTDFTNSINLSDILLEMTKYSIGCCFFVDENDYLIGILTDGDIRRLHCNIKNINIIKLEHINKNFYFETDLNKTYNDIKNIKKYKFIPILDEKKIIGIIKY
jgi:arabinose-5-phosphate isomerase